MENINKLRKFYKLKDVERNSEVGSRKESSAEHSWSCLILADYFLTSMNGLNLNRMKIYELLMYHDVVEIETGDIPIHHEEERKNKKKMEKEAMMKLKEDFPQEIREKAWEIFQEFEESDSKEAKFTRAIDKIDALIHELDYKQRWKGWDEERVRKYHGKAIAEFPELIEVFEKILKYATENSYFNQ